MNVKYITSIIIINIMYILLLLYVIYSYQVSNNNNNDNNHQNSNVNKNINDTNDTDDTNDTNNNMIINYYDIEPFYPKDIPEYNIRKDVYTNENVTRNRLSLIGGLIKGGDKHEKITLKEFQKVLQCPEYEPELIGKRGSLHLYNLINITKSTVENLCAYLQTECSPWKSCRDEIPTLKSQPYSKSNFLGSPFQAKLYRIINNELYYDWPWGSYYEEIPPASMTSQIIAVLLRVSDLKDSVFIMGEEISFLPFNVPFPAFTNSPKLSSSEIPFPFYQEVVHEKKLISNGEIHKKKQTDDEEKEQTDDEEKEQTDDEKWNLRLSKAVFYGTLTSIRQIFFDIAAKRPDLIDAKWIGGDYAKPWNPNSMDLRLESNDSRYYDESLKKEEAEVGSLKNLLKSRIPFGETYNVLNYKFVVVLTGADGYATADRLAAFLAHSGAVVMIQEHSFAYTFSSYLKPWVHYVPLSYTTADIISKLEFLINNDNIARRIAQNSRNFGISHLRYEDYLCYTASALSAISKVTSKADANIPFNATKVLIPDEYY